MNLYHLKEEQSCQTQEQGTKKEVSKEEPQK